MCWKRGAYFAQVNASGTSQTCPNCSAHRPKDLSVRVHHCRECDYTCHRDSAAAQMVLIRGWEKVEVARCPSHGHLSATVVPVDNRRQEIACEVLLPRVFDLDRWRSAGRLKQQS
ncbi:MAG: transposase [Cyanosarcina radialis HA8281-LM2]|nr:transposase [Cyanosarcina radialis HA8281-LM2]